MNPSNYKFVFVAGLHRSGTSVLARSIEAHPAVSGFSGTGVPQDEGQFLQPVYPAAKEYGGPGKFGFEDAMHLTETSPLVSQENREKIVAGWSRYWDTDKPVLLEKSPPNLLKTRFLQALFPGSYFIVIMRHPVAVSYATQKWSKASIKSMLEHWIVCYNRFEKDRKHLQHCLQLKYEDFVVDPGSYLKKIAAFIGLEALTPTERPQVEKDKNHAYLEAWKKEVNRLCTQDESQFHNEYRGLREQIERFGYSLY